MKNKYKDVRWDELISHLSLTFNTVISIDFNVDGDAVLVSDNLVLHSGVFQCAASKIHPIIHADTLLKSENAYWCSIKLRIYGGKNYMDFPVMSAWFYKPTASHPEGYWSYVKVSDIYNKSK